MAVQTFPRQRLCRIHHDPPKLLPFSCLAPTVPLSFRERAFLKASINRIKVRRKRSYVPVRRTKVPAKHMKAQEQVSCTEDSAKSRSLQRSSVAVVSLGSWCGLGLVSPSRITLGMNVGSRASKIQVRLCFWPRSRRAETLAGNRLASAASDTNSYLRFGDE